MKKKTKVILKIAGATIGSIGLTGLGLFLGEKLGEKNIKDKVIDYKDKVGEEKERLFKAVCDYPDLDTLEEGSEEYKVGEYLMQKDSECLAQYLVLLDLEKKI